MAKIREDSRGFGHVEVFLIIVVVIVVGIAGWYVADHNKTNTKSPTVSLNVTPTSLKNDAQSGQVPVTSTRVAPPIASSTDANTSATTTPAQTSSPPTSSTTAPVATAATPTITDNSGTTVMTITPDELGGMYNDGAAAQTTTDTVGANANQTVAVLAAKTGSGLNPGYGENYSIFTDFIKQYDGQYVKECANIRTTSGTAQVNLLFGFGTAGPTDLIPAATVTIGDTYQTYCTPYQAFLLSTGPSADLTVSADIYNTSPTSIYIASISLLTQ